MKVNFYIDEMYPVIFVEPVRESSPRKIIEISDELYEEYKRVCKEFNAIQEKLEKYE